jgi:hypothetical protein
MSETFPYWPHPPDAVRKRKPGQHGAEKPNAVSQQRAKCGCENCSCSSRTPNAEYAAKPKSTQTKNTTPGDRGEITQQEGKWAGDGIAARHIARNARHVEAERHRHGGKACDGDPAESVGRCDEPVHRRAPNDPSSATRPAGRHDCNSDAMAGFAAAHG